MVTNQLEHKTFENTFLEVAVKAPYLDFSYQQQTVTWYRVDFS